MTPLSPDGFAAQTGVSRETVARLEAYAGLLKRWSGRINLVSRNTLGDLWRRHFLDSAQLLRLIPEKTRNLADLGSGAGFPGLVLAILGVPGVELLESDQRKCVFLREAARIANAPVKIIDSRIETVKPHAADVITARACAPLDKLLPLAQRFIVPETICLFLKGENVEEELTAARRNWRMSAARLSSRADPRGVIL
ncbi:MAG: 16S rRNA (guanine(527)-N(7))-methyltransferase RsmG, partial [Alphaproteobacteria bacterium]|nr:16S rRNA (guanine(527)-N(7))-methyltransferase RsmG [Alphaproteobacteria bacterium]